MFQRHFKSVLRLLFAVGILASGTVLVAYADLIRRPLNWRTFASVYDPDLDVNHDEAAPGSVLAFTGVGYPANSIASVYANGQFLGTVNTRSNGTLGFLVDTTNAPFGSYEVIASVGANASDDDDFDLEPGNPVYPAPPGFDGPTFWLVGGPTPSPSPSPSPSSTPNPSVTPDPTETPEPTETVEPTETPEPGEEDLIVNYDRGQSGSFFTFTGTNFTPNSLVEISVQDMLVLSPESRRLLGTVMSNSAGTFSFILETTNSLPGTYILDADDGSNSDEATIHIDPTAPKHLQEGLGEIFYLAQQQLFLPILRRP